MYQYNYSEKSSNQSESLNEKEVYYSQMNSKRTVGFDEISKGVQAATHYSEETVNFCMLKLIEFMEQNPDKIVKMGPLELSYNQFTGIKVELKEE